MKIRFPAGLIAVLILVLMASARPSRGQEFPEETPLPLKAVRAFPNLRIELPTVLTHAGDGSDRLFVTAQRGKVHVFSNEQDVAETTVFLDIEDRVVYKKEENEEGLLGLAFHPRYRENGEFFLYYTTADAPHTSVVSRFRVTKDDPNRADPDSEEELLRLKQPFWNHNGGALVFGPDGMLYIGLGDGGKANDPLENGQNLSTLLGSILRIDIDRKDDGKSYAIPRDNPFVDRDSARGEIWAYGLRNVWGMSFDRKTGTFWAADVGQDTWEEVDIIVKGGNYGWNLREGLHPFGRNGVGPREDLIDPIWEYHHDRGKSITGGYVYRGERLPDLQGAYLCADYVTGLIWALRYDQKGKRLTAVHTIPDDNKHPVIAFGEDEAGDVYFTTIFGMIFRFEEK